MHLQSCRADEAHRSSRGSGQNRDMNVQNGNIAASAAAKDAASASVCVFVSVSANGRP